MAGISNADEYRIQAVGDTGIHAEDRWVAVLHEPCDEYVFGDEIAAHHCAATAGEMQARRRQRSGTNS